MKKLIRNSEVGGGGRNGSASIEQQLAALARLSAGALRERYQHLFGEPSRSGNRDFLFKRCAWRLQSLTEGTLSERAKRRAEELARDADLRLTIPRTPKPRMTLVANDSGGAVHTLALAPAPSRDDHLPPPGTVLSRPYRGTTIKVTVLQDGFEWQGQVYRSLTAVAKAVSGSHCSGRAFFGLNKDKDKNS